MNISLKNGFLVTPENNGFKVEKKDVYIYDGIVSFEKKNVKFDRDLDLNEAVIMPGLVNAHHHIYSTLSKGIPVVGPLEDFQGTLEKLWWKLDRVLEKDDVIASTVITLEDSIKQGVSTIFDHHISVPFIKGSLNEMKKVFGQYCLNAVLAFEISNRNGKEIFNESLEENIEFYKKHLTSKYIKGTIGMHASFTIDEDSMQVIKDTIGDAPIHIHVAEAGSDVEETIKISGLPVIERLEKYNLLNKNSLIVHGNVLTENELDILSKKELFVIHNPDSNMNNTLKIKNISETLAKGITLTVGTDGMTSNMLKSYKNAFLLNRYINQNPDTGWGEANEVLLNAFKLKEAYGFSLGVEEGEEADLIIFDYIPATAFNNDTFLGHFLFGLTESRVRYFFKRENIQLDDYKLTKTTNRDFFNNTRKNSNKLFERFKNL
jgi:cytosine/adenosine deaminase-related metal-dependent hydrolase